MHARTVCGCIGGSSNRLQIVGEAAGLQGGAWHLHQHTPALRSALRSAYKDPPRGAWAPTLIYDMIVRSAQTDMMACTPRFPPVRAPPGTSKQHVGVPLTRSTCSRQASTPSRMRVGAASSLWGGSAAGTAPPFMQCTNRSARASGIARGGVCVCTLIGPKQKDATNGPGGVEEQPGCSESPKP